ncbi:MAG: 50S ribosomal protein L25 [Candidatus Omnitrophica bacterium]|nr:50S ribosomal protein L25 [Candidatus Omnitrophota bacterium]
MKRVDLHVSKREASGKGGARSTRRAGMIPGVIYGEGQESQVIAVDRVAIEKALRSGGDNENILVNVKFEGESGETLTLVRETQHDPLTGALKHLDFRRVSTDRAIIINVPVHAVGTPKGVREGGILEQQLRDVEIECLPLEIPEALKLDVSGVAIGGSLHVSDIPQDPKYKILTPLERAVIMVSAPKLEAAPTAAEEAESEAAAGEEAGEEKAEAEG